MTANNTTTTVKWTDHLVLRFVTLYRDRPCLWQSDHPEYKCKMARAEALRSLVRDMDTEGFDMYACKMKIKNMRSYYCHKLRKICRSVEDGGERYMPSLIWFPLLHSFLNKYVRYVGTETQSSKTLSVDDCEDEDQNFNMNVDVVNVVFGDDDNFAEQVVANDSPIETDKRTKRFSFPPEAKICKKIKLEQEDDVVETEFDVFSRSVAQHLNSLPLENALRLQHNIQNLVIEERLRCIREAEDVEHTNSKYQFQD